MNNDVEIAGDALALPHLLPAPPKHPATLSAFAALVRTLADEPERWRPLVRYDATLRWYHRLDQRPGYELWLSSWLPGQGSGRHDHGVSRGLCTVLEGELTERSVRRGDGGEESRVLRPGTLRAFAPGYVHDVVNSALTPAVSAHVYYPALTGMRMRCSSAPGRAEPARLPTGA
ncbi:cysteine dioxygenase [Streptomyces xiaopingdaonensis]|uniref:cysteine dioxygenase n=1 Tax=Streptomyces xiaopingdaonensis TaxID=1565415 RepID=UPI0002FD546D|nr:cysteine dioxygenase family protein [Streptomyces xiaopingdaonensis]